VKGVELSPTSVGCGVDDLAALRRLAGFANGHSEALRWPPQRLAGDVVSVAKGEIRGMPVI
jgi:hypothetical protein